MAHVETNSQLRDGFDRAAGGFAIWDSTGQLLYSNRPFRMALPLAIEVQEGMRYKDFVADLLASGEFLVPVAAENWSAEHRDQFGQNKTWEQQMADGRTLEFHQITGPDGCMTLSIHDISSRKSVESELRRARDAAEASDEDKSRFLRAANHDLRQPLASLKILIYNCLSEPDEEHRHDLLNTMNLSVVIMENLLSALLQIGQLDAGQIKPNVTNFQMAQLFERLRLQFDHQADGKGLRLSYRGMRHTVASDKALLERIVTNLVANAIRYTQTGGIVVACRPCSRGFRIEVWDTGCGIASEQLPHIFDEFYQVPETGNHHRAGVGLGLSIVSRLAEILEHPVEVNSQLGRGTVFRVTVPSGDVWRSESSDIEISESIGGEFVGTVVLLIEDDAVLREAMRSLLDRWGMEVLATATWAEAEDLLNTATAPPDLLLADYSLSGEFGTDVAKALRLRLGYDLPTLIITAENVPEVTARIRAADFPMLIKPVSPPRLRVMMHNLLFEK